MIRFGKIISLKDEFVKQYKELHSGPAVRDLLSKHNIQNFSIFLHRLPDGQLYEFAYYEYVGTNFDEDMRNLDSDPENIEWQKLCGNMQVSLPDSDGWTDMEQIFFSP